MHNFFNIPPQSFSISAVIVGMLLVSDLTPNEQNALGNWLMLTSQYLCTNAIVGQLQQSNTQTPGSFNERTRQSTSFQNPTNEETLNMLTKMVNALNQEINEIKKSL